MTFVPINPLIKPITQSKKHTIAARKSFLVDRNSIFALRKVVSYFSIHIFNFAY